MLKAPLVIPIQARPQPENDGLDPLWRPAGDVRASRALIVARHGLDLMCGLLRRGCWRALRIGAMHCWVDPPKPLRILFWIALVLAVAAYGSVVVRNVTDALVGITTKPSVVVVQRPSR